LANRAGDYKAAKLPVLPVVKSVVTTKLNIAAYILAFIASLFALAVIGYEGAIYLTTAGIVSLGWLWLCLKGFSAKDNKRWARQMFIFSLFVISFLSLAISLDALLL
jgi:protoheme IX farnesyltransferase